MFNAVDILALHLLLLSTAAFHWARSLFLPLRSLAALALWVRMLRIIILWRGT
jgi:hypothetical protein